MDVKSEASGKVTKVDADTVGRASLALGAGRSRADDEIDFSVGFDQIIKTGTHIKSGDVIGRVHAANAESADTAADSLRNAVDLS
jgi:thymidine phosphorylase